MNAYRFSSRMRWLMLLCCTMFLGLLVHAERPNIIFLITDDQFKDQTNWMPQGKGSSYTPTTDSMAEEGTRLLQQYVTSPVCTPSRFSCMTGLYPSRSEAEDFVQKTKQNGQSIVGWNTYVTADTPTVAKFLKQAGYSTGFVGKNHVVETPGFVRGKWDDSPEDSEVKALLERNRQLQVAALKQAGFDYAAALYQNNPGHNGVHELASHNLDWLAQGAGEFIKQERESDQPFFLWVASTVPHGPLNPENSWKADRRITADGMLEEPLHLLSNADELEQRLKEVGNTQWYAKNMLWLDDLVAYLMNQLKETGVYDNTVFIYFSDHGQKSKGTVYQGGVHSLAFVWKKGGFPVGESTDVRVSNVDFVPTILDLAGVEYDPEQFDGKSMLPVLEGKTDKLHDSLYFELGFVRGVIKGKWKYVALRYPDWVDQIGLDQRKRSLKQLNDRLARQGRKPHNTDPMARFSHVQLIPGGGDAEHASMGQYPGYYDPDQLYNLEVDPDEQQNLANDPEYAEVLADMKRELQSYLQDLPGGFAELDPPAAQ